MTKLKLICTKFSVSLVFFSDLLCVSIVIHQPLNHVMTQSMVVVYEVLPLEGLNCQGLCI